MKILIAEDELLERKAMKKFIEDNFSDLEVVGEAANGRKAIELAEITEPDIIFMDIKMPGINGLEAIEQIVALDSSIRFILVSAYDSFDYAKQAMHYGIRDYILKPGKKEEIVKALLRIKKEIMAERQEETERRESEKLREERLLANLMKHPVAEGTYELQQQLFPDRESSCFLVLASDRTYDVQQVEDSLAAHLDDHFILVSTTECLTVCIVANTILTKEALLKAARKIHVDLGEEMFIGIGQPSEALGKLPSSYHDAYTACFQLKRDNKSRYGFMQEEQATDSEIDMIAEICGHIEKGNSHEAITHFKDQHQLLQEADKERLYISARNILEAHQVTLPGTSLSSLHTERDWVAFLNICSMKLNEIHTSKQHIARAKHYIMENFNRTITLEEVAEWVDLSPNYLSNMFKQAYGDTFIDFLTKERLKQAKYLLQENTHSLKEISFMIGYNDPNYFSRVFKKHYHVSPKQFQKAIFKK